MSLAVIPDSKTLADMVSQLQQFDERKRAAEQAEARAKEAITLQGKAEDIPATLAAAQNIRREAKQEREKIIADANDEAAHIKAAADGLTNDAKRQATEIIAAAEKESAAIKVEIQAARQQLADGQKVFAEQQKSLTSALDEAKRLSTAAEKEQAIANAERERYAAMMAQIKLITGGD